MTRTDIAGLRFVHMCDPGAEALTCGVGEDLFFQNGNDSKNCENQDTTFDVENKIYTLRADYAADRFTFTSISGFVDRMSLPRTRKWSD